MNSFRNHRLRNLTLTTSTTWLLPEESKEDCCEAPQRSSQRGHEGKHDLTSWRDFFLAIIRRTCAEFEPRAGQVKSPAMRKTALVLDATQRPSYKLSVPDLQKEGLGRGHQARWRRKSNG